jgi:hypothetical protein
MKARWAIIALGFCVCAPGASTTSARDGGFSTSIYPPPRNFPNWGLLGGCPSLKGVHPYQRSGESAALRVLLRFGRNSLLSDLRNSDRALWQTIAVDWAQRGSSKRARNAPIVAHSGSGRSAPDAPLIRTNCGDRILQDSTWFSTCPPRTSASCYPALRAQFLLLNRRGHWLVWFEG